MISEFSQQAGFSNFESELFTRGASEYLRYEDNYNEADNEFQKKWKDAILKTPENDRNDFSKVWNTYKQLNPGVPYDMGYPILDSYDDVNNVHLKRRLHETDYFNVSGTGTGLPGTEAPAFESGITTVPYDNYAALLHEGERVLTKEEAKSYNKLSSYLMEQTYNNATNSGFSTYINNNNSTANNDDLNNSIKSQTTAVGDKLDRILNALEALIKQMSVPRARTASDNYNVMMLNSDTTQVATAL
jgi:hypothetical protein